MCMGCCVAERAVKEDHSIDISQHCQLLWHRAALLIVANYYPACVPPQAQIVDILLSAIKLEAAISLPPILHVLSCLARDLQQDFLPCLPRVLTSLSDLVDSGLLSDPRSR